MLAAHVEGDAKVDEKRIRKLVFEKERGTIPVRKAMIKKAKPCYVK